MSSLVDTLNDILIGKIAYETDIPEAQLRAHPMLWDCLNDDETTLDETIDYMCELGYRGEFTFRWETE